MNSVARWCSGCGLPLVGSCSCGSSARGSPRALSSVLNSGNEEVVNTVVTVDTVNVSEPAASREARSALVRLTLITCNVAFWIATVLIAFIIAAFVACVYAAYLKYGR